MTQPATNTKATTRKAAAKKPTTTKATAKQKANTSAKATKTAATKATKATPAAEPKLSKGEAFGESNDANNLIRLHDSAKAATEQFEGFVCDLIRKGISPTHIGNSSVRRIAMRNGLDIK